MRVVVGVVVVGVVVILLALRYRHRATPSVVCARIKRREYTATPLLGVVLSRDECDFFVREAEKHAAARGGWSKKRHEHYPTTDLDTAKVPALRYPVHNLVYTRIIPKIASHFELDAARLGIKEVFIAKYSAATGHQRRLGAHRDGSDFSFIVALNDGFDGGGTMFVRSNTVVRPGAGKCVVFCGRNKHMGIAVTRGTRYIMAGFLAYGTPKGCDDSSDDESDND